jgi:hypothetical protein
VSFPLSIDLDTYRPVYQHFYDHSQQNDVPLAMFHDLTVQGDVWWPTEDECVLNDMNSYPYLSFEYFVFMTKVKANLVT